MKNYKILVPLDFSDAGTFALQAAQKMAQLFDGTITPFHSYVPVSDMQDTDPFEISFPSTSVADIEETEKIHRQNLKEFCSGVVSDRILEEPVVEVGNPAAAIAETAKKFDLIVMSSHGRTGFSRFFLGSVSDKVLRTAHTPVLIVKKEKQLQTIDNILLTTDFSEHAKNAFPLAKEIARKANAKITLLNVLSFDIKREKPDQTTIDKRKKRLDDLAHAELSAVQHQLETRVIVSSDSPHEAILNEDLNNNYSLIIMSSVGHTGIEYLMMGSTTSNVVRHVESPVLSINPKKKSSNREE